MSITLLHWTVIGIYTALFVIMVIFFEIRLNYLHRRHIDKISPVGESGLKKIDQRLRMIVRIIFVLLFIVSLSLILTIL
ncbi:MAG: hypothetical protein Q8K26_01035 [Candidatus Gracilibacteria bacterium]|nr:hypothetical protein [Candidatus Gracilibacteria bacterium]